MRPTILAVITWVPLVVFSLLEGLALDGSRIPFLYDIAAHARFLVAVPILILAEIPIGTRLREIATHFLDAGLVREEERKRFASCVVDTVRFHDWRLAELTLLALAYITTYAAISKMSLQSGMMWYESSGTMGLAPIGYYYAFVALPIFQFLVYRWRYPDGRVDEISMARVEAFELVLLALIARLRRRVDDIGLRTRREQILKGWVEAQSRRRRRCDRYCSGDQNPRITRTRTGSQ